MGHLGSPDYLGVQTSEAFVAWQNLRRQLYLVPGLEFHMAVQSLIVPTLEIDKYLTTLASGSGGATVGAGSSATTSLITLPRGILWKIHAFNILRSGAGADNTFNLIFVRESSAATSVPIISAGTGTANYYSGILAQPLELREFNQIGIIPEGAGAAASTFTLTAWVSQQRWN